MTSVKNPATGHTIVAATRAEAQRGAEVVADYFDGNKPAGLFAPAQPDPAARDDMLSRVDKRLSPSEAKECEGPTGDGSLTAAELKNALRTMQRGKSPGSAPCHRGLARAGGFAHC